MKNFKSFLAFLVLLASTALAPPGQAWAQAEQDQWKVVPTNMLRDEGGICVGPACNKKREDYLAQLLKVCLYRDPSTAGFFARGEWRTHVGENAPQPCQGVMYAHPTRKIIFILAQFQHVGSYQPYIYCPHKPTRDPGTEVCNSEFLKLRDAQGGYRVVDLPVVQQAMREAQVTDAIDRHLQAVATQQKAQQRAEYLVAFENAKDSLQAMKQFEEEYGSNDPDGLISQFPSVKQGLRLEEYRKRFAGMKTIPEIERFIADYEHDDVGKKVPEARLWLAHERKLEADAAKALARQKAVEDGTARLSELERMIIWCRRESAAARRAIEQENQIGRVSGFVNRQRLHTAGQTIVHCEQANPRDFDEYKRRGGKRSYGELQ